MKRIRTETGAAAARIIVIVGGMSVFGRMLVVKTQIKES